ncbi:MAG TPA: hypothetical protein PKZ54_03125 [Syntrophorhabdaceae bacterium]|nr:hypothetical protein [Syntrophorhabdaceae bacterium]
MTRKVKIESNLKIKNLFEPPFILNLDGTDDDLLAVLKKLSTSYPFLRFTENGEMGDDIRYVYINGISHFDLPEGLRTKVFDGDKIFVETYMDPLAGG